MKSCDTPRERRRTDRDRAHDRRTTRDRHEHQRRRELVADGGTRRQQFELPDPGEPVRDRKQGDLLVAVEVHPDTPAAAWHIDAIAGRPTVADVNPQFSPDAPVVLAVYDDDERETDNLRKWAYAGEVKTYTFPADRLEAVDAGGDA